MVFFARVQSGPPLSVSPNRQSCARNRKKKKNGFRVTVTRYISLRWHVHACFFGVSPLAMHGEQNV